MTHTPTTKTGAYISRCDCFKVHRQPKRYADTRKRVPQDFAHCVEVARQLVHIRSRRMPLWHNKDLQEQKIMLSNAVRCVLCGNRSGNRRRLKAYD